MNSGCPDTDHSPASRCGRAALARWRGALAAAGVLALAGCVAPVGPVEVTRFSAPAADFASRGTVSVEPGPGQDANSLEFRAYAGAVAQELAGLGYRAPLPGAAPAPRIAVLDLERRTWQPERGRSPVSVGVGGSTGSYGSGLGVGLGFDLSGPPPAQVETRLHVILRDRAATTPVWEGRAAFVVRADSPLAQTPLGAAKMAAALFKGFPGNSGETIYVK
ncbi:DUF4136 domain-containing protein [Novosphingobium colocasiae]|uniref:DUF4136 domain-containing protein n=1 Tax=Novosphingobium colocasiae TaxID=1256513 RepID=UPI0035AFACB1